LKTQLLYINYLSILILENIVSFYELKSKNRNNVFVFTYENHNLFCVISVRISIILDIYNLIVIKLKYYLWNIELIFNNIYNLIFIKLKYYLWYYTINI